MSNKKLGLTFCWTLQKPMLLELTYNLYGQKDLFQRLKWGIVHLCTEIHQKISKYLFSNFHVLLKVTILLHKIKKIVKLFFPTSPFLSKVKGSNITHFNPWNKSFWPLRVLLNSWSNNFRKKCPSYFSLVIIHQGWI